MTRRARLFPDTNLSVRQEYRIAMDRYPLTDEQILFYRENGYVALPDVLTTEELADLHAASDEVLSTTYDPIHDRAGGNIEYTRIFVQKVNMWRFHEGIARHTLNRRIADIARRLAQAKGIRLWHDHLLTKMPDGVVGGSKPTPWHQDRPYWPMNELGQLSCWMAIEDVNAENGCMSFVAKSHTWGLLEPIHLTSPRDFRELVPGLTEADIRIEQVPLRAGSCTFHNGLTFHSAGANRTNRPRKAMVTIYTPDGTTYSGKGHIVTDPLGLKPGDPLAGDMFPLLSQEAAD